MPEEHLIMKMKRTLQEKEKSKQGKEEEEDLKKIKALPASRAQINNAVWGVRAALQMVNKWSIHRP